jgi:hypothetical protein
MFEISKGGGKQQTIIEDRKNIYLFIYLFILFCYLFVFFNGDFLHA